MGRKLIDYYPQVLKEFREFQMLAGTEQEETDQLWGCQYSVLDDQFAATVSEGGAMRWEKILGIVPKATASLQERRFLILTRLAEELPYTVGMLRQQLDALCGAGGYTASVEPGEYTVTVRVALTAKGNYDDVGSLLGRVLPANMVLDLSLLYNQHGTVGRLTHGQLKGYQHDKIRNEVI